MENLHKHAAAADRTILMVAHRLTTMRRTDRVLVMSEGSIVQNGTYAKLSSTSGTFQDLLHSAELEETKRTLTRELEVALTPNHSPEIGSPMRSRSGGSHLALPIASKLQTISDDLQRIITRDLEESWPPSDIQL